MVFTTATAEAVFPVAALVSLASSLVLVTRLERIAGRIGLSEAMLGLAVALAADSPEITSAVTAAVNGKSSVGTGVILGSNLFNLAALLGLAAIVAGRIELHRRVVIFEGVAALWLAAVTVVVVAARLDTGAGLLLALLVVVPYLVVSASPDTRLRRLGVPAAAIGWLRGAVVEEERELARAIHPRARGRLDVTSAAVALAVVVGASVVMERSAERAGRHLGLSSTIIGAVVLAAVTSLPNAVGGVYLAVRGRATAVLSEAMNSNMINVVVGLLLAGVIIGLNPSAGDGAVVAGWYGALTVVSLAFAYAGRGLDRSRGALIVAGYGAFVYLVIAR